MCLRRRHFVTAYERVKKMYDNLNSDNELKEINEDDKTSSRILNELIHEYEDKLYTIRIQLKSYISQLEIKEHEINVTGQKKDNRNLFSPIYNNNSEALNDIENLKNRINELTQRENYLSDTIYGLTTAFKCVNSYITESKPDPNDKKKKARLNDIGLSILEAQEIERQRIARDLHDTTVQNLTSMVHKTELCIKLIEIDTIRAKLELNTMSNTIKTVINDMRGIIYNLKPMTLDDLGLTVTVQRYANKVIDLSNIDIIVTANDEPTKILSVIKLTLFRVIQEACCNVLKHANASLIEINILYEKNMIIVTVKDDGTGFDTEKLHLNNPEQTSSFGLSIMKERISLLSGSLEIQSEKEKGTTITISVPLSKHEEEKNE